MPLSSSSSLHVSERNLRRAESATVVARMAIIGMIAWIANSSLQALRRGEHSQLLLHSLELTQRDILDATANHHAYMLTGDATARADFAAAAARTTRDLAVLDSLGAGVPGMRPRLDSLRVAHDALTRMRAASLQVSARPSEAARAALDTPDQLAVKREISRLLDTMSTSERERLAGINALQLRNFRLQGLCGLVAVLVTGLVGGVTLRYRRQRADALRTSEATFRSLAQDNPDCVFVHVAGEIVFANAAAAAMFCGAARPIDSLTVDAIVHPDDRATTQERTQLVTDHRVTTEPRVVRFLRHDGTTFEAEARGAPIMFDGRAAIQVVLRDLSGRREAERALSLSEERFRAVLDAMAEGVVLQDDTLTIQLCNPAAERILGLTHDQMAGRTSFDPSWRATNERGDDLPGEEHVAAVALRTGVPVTGVMGVERGDAARVWIAVNAVPLFRPDRATPYAVVVTFEDITSQRQASEALRDSEARYRLLAEHSADLISRRSSDFRFLYASPSHEAVLGWTPDELVGRSTVEFLHPDDVERVNAFRERRFTTGERQVITLRLRHKDGHYVWLEAAAAEVRTADGQPDGLVVSARDITARLALEEELRQSQKMQVLGRMASGVAHDFNNLLTIIRSSSELLRLDAAHVPAALQTLADIELATDRATALTAHLLTFSRRQHVAPDVLRPAPLLGESMALLRRIAGEKVTLSMAVSPTLDVDWIRADAIRLEQVLTNLVGNARDAMHGGGSIRIRCDAVDMTDTTTHRFGVINPGRYLRISVEDNGSGMTDEVLTSLFDPFFTTKPHGRGTGLGLSIVHGIVYEAQGTITVSSEPGFGSCFTVYWPTVSAPSPAELRSLTRTPQRGVVPASSAAVPMSAPAPKPAGPASAGRPSILLVDDDDSVRRVVMRQLETGGYAVREAANGFDALSILREGDRRSARSSPTCACRA